MNDFAALTGHVRAGGVLEPAHVAAAVEGLTAAQLPPETKAEFLAALAVRGETADELAAFAAELRARSVPVPVTAAVREAGILDVCGTGGDRLNTFNISTTVAILAAAAGVTVAKHGNRAITSQSGSSEVLQALGIRIDFTPEEAAAALGEHRFAFFFAPKYHPAFQHIAPARKICAERGQRTIFNLMGPLLNPARPTMQLVGVPRPEFCQPIALVLQRLGLRRAWVVCGQTGSGHLDELSTVGPSVAAGFGPGENPVAITINPADVGLRLASLDDLQGGNPEANAAIIRKILHGEDRGPKRDAVLLNAAAALQIAGRVNTLPAGLALAAQTIDSGSARLKLAELSAA